MKRVRKREESKVGPELRERQMAGVPIVFEGVRAILAMGRRQLTHGQHDGRPIAVPCYGTIFVNETQQGDFSGDTASRPLTATRTAY